MHPNREKSYPNHIAQAKSITIENVVHASSDYNVGETTNLIGRHRGYFQMEEPAAFQGYHRADGSCGDRQPFGWLAHWSFL